MLNPRESSIISVSFTDDCEIIQSENPSENILTVFQYILENATIKLKKWKQLLIFYKSF